MPEYQCHFYFNKSQNSSVFLIGSNRIRLPKKFRRTGIPTDQPGMIMWKLDVIGLKLQDQMNSIFQLWYCTTSRPLPTALLVSSWTTKLSRKQLLGSSYILKAQSHLSNNLVTSHICHSCLLTGLRGKLVTSIHRSCSDVPLWSSFIIIIFRWYLWFSGKSHQDTYTRDNRSGKYIFI